MVGMYGCVCLCGCVYIQKIVTDLCFHSFVVVLVTDPKIWVGRHVCTEFAFGVDGGRVLSVLAERLR